MRIKHSGALGDIIYGLPYLKSLNKEIEFYVGEHSFVNSQINEFNSEANVKMINTFFPENFRSATANYSNYKMVKKLLESQSYIKKVKPFTTDSIIDFNMDSFRQYWNSNDHISDIVLKAYNTSYTWKNEVVLENIPVNDSFKNCFVCARSFRYRPGNGTERWKYKFKNLKQDLKPIFIGLQNEYLDFKFHIGDAEYIPTQNLYDVATVINSCEFGIYNGSSPLAIAVMLNKRTYVEGIGEPYIASVSTNLSNQELF